jgi:DNA-directed RNA polymerase subunit RPC12/RpoP
MEEQEKIIVIQRFDNLIEANIIKTKLDAFGVPCFLSEENLTSLTTSLLSGGIRLHIFEQDKDQVLQLLVKESMHMVEEDDLIHCPSCRSRKILNMSSRRFEPAQVVRFILQLTKRHYCLDCEAEFD